MANQQHIEWLLEGVEAWNARRQHDDFVPDFSGAKDLRARFEAAGLLSNAGRMEMMWANLRGADLREAVLWHANLRRANLRRANLREAVLGGADLRRADLGGANLREADLGGADLREAVLGGADLRRADLGEADLGGADLRTVYSGTSANDLSVPAYTNLSRIRSLTQDQLNTMRGDHGVILPNGLTYPDHWPEPQPPTESAASGGFGQGAYGIGPYGGSGATIIPFLFLSYASDDRHRIDPLHAFLAAQDIPVWWDQDIPAGGAWRDTITERLASADAILTVWTARSTASKAVIEEASTAQAARKLLHVRLDDAPLPYGFAETQYVDLRDWDGTATHPGMAKLLQAIRDKLDPPSSAELTDRHVRASPVAFRPMNGMLAAVDTPTDTRPAVSNPADLEDRIHASFELAGRLAHRIEVERIYQVPPDLPIRLREFARLAEAARLTWYALDDARCSITDVIEVHDGRDAWNDALLRDLDRLSDRVDQIEPLLRPAQIPPGEPDTKPAVPDADLAALPEADIESIADEAERELESVEAVDVFDPSAVDALARELRHLREGLDKSQPDTRRKRWLRRGLLGLSMLMGSYIVAVSQGVAVNLLTAPDAALTLATRLQPILDAILKFFL